MDNTKQYLDTTLTLKEMDGRTVPFQNNIVYPTFEPQKRPIISLHQIWKKQRFQGLTDLSMTKRTDAVIQTLLEDPVISLDFDDQEWEDIMIPSIENKATGEESTKGMEQYQDGCWYRTRFDVNIEAGKVYQLKCLGLSYIGDVFLNGHYVGYHEGGYTPFAFDLTPWIVQGENVLVIRVDNPKWGSRHDIIPATEGTDFFNYTGIIHDIYIDIMDQVHIDRVDVVTPNTKGDVLAHVVLTNQGNASATVEIDWDVYLADRDDPLFLDHPYAIDLAKEKVQIERKTLDPITLKAQETKVVPVSFKINNVRLWSVNDPNLYVLNVGLKQSEQVINEVAVQFGVRTIETEGSHILLNGESIFLSGVARHEEWPIHGRSATWERIKQDLTHIKSLYVNYVRTAHYPNHIYTYLLLDRLGLLSAAEIPLWQFTTKHYEVNEQKGLSYQMFREMVYSNYNRPSIIMWSTQNESTDVQLRKVYNEKLVSEVRTNYCDGRLVTQSAAADQPGYYDESMEPLDVYGWTMYFGVFHGSTPYEGTRHFIEHANKHWPNKPIVNTEYGVWSFDDDSQMEYQYEVYDHVLQSLVEKATVTPDGKRNDRGYIAGINYWTVYNWYINHNNFFQTMGLYRMDRKTEKLITQPFIRDQHYLLGNHHGIAKHGPLETKELILLNEEKTLEPNEKLVLSVRNHDYFYLTIDVMNEKETAPLVINFISNQETEVVQTFKIEPGHHHQLNVLLHRISHWQDVHTIEIDRKDYPVTIQSVRLTNQVVEEN